MCNIVKTGEQNNKELTKMLSPMEIYNFKTTQQDIVKDSHLY